MTIINTIEVLRQTWDGNYQIYDPKNGGVVVIPKDQAVALGRELMRRAGTEVTDTKSIEVT